MKYRLPEDCVGLSHAGVTFELSADGVIEADEALAVHLAPHGIVPVAPDEKPEKTKADARRLLR